MSELSNGGICLVSGMWTFFGTATLAAAALTLMGFLARLWWIFDLAGHFRVQYLAILLACGVAYSLNEQTGMATFATLFALVNFFVLLRLYIRPGAGDGQGQAYRVLLANVLQKNPSSTQLTALIQEKKPDFIFLVEPNQRWLDELQLIQPDYPYWAAAPRQDNYGLALISRIPIEKHEIRTFVPKGVPSVIAELQLDGSRMTLIATHPPPPKSAALTRMRNRQMEELARFASAQDGEVIVCGDLNMTPWTPPFLRVLKISRLRDSTRGFGLQPTWPVNNLLFRVPIDHCLHSKGLRVVNRSVGKAFGSDHFPLIIDFHFTGE